MEIREITAADAPGIARVHVRAWQHGYAGLVDPEFLAGLTVAQRTVEWRDVWLAQPSQGARLAAEVDDEIVGFVVGTTESPTEGCGEIFSIYVDPDAWGTGAGSALLRAASAELRADRTRPLVLWVLEGNDRAITFYERHGWRADGARKDEELGAWPAPHLRYRLEPDLEID
ncbi:MAG: GNAT family N-acetyltransferase [Acidimicrobiales bacterium]|nr:GNAT family N-acetyltransferase [Acidimicrobiales bacterium]